MTEAPTAQDGVVLFHGIFRTARNMRRFERFFERHGYATLNVDYPSTRHSLAQITALVRPEVEAFCARIPGRVHFVGFSMGGLVIRLLLAQAHPSNLGRVVMLGTPNHGSEVADFVQRWRLYRRLYGPAGQELTTAAARLLPAGPVAYELGVLAGSLPLDPICPLLIGRPSDGLVAVGSTQLAGMKDHRTVRATHLFFPLHRGAWNHTLHFIRHGYFAQADSPTHR